nr:restriction endonuclease subunit S [Zobellella denitrificans]
MKPNSLVADSHVTVIRPLLTSSLFLNTYISSHSVQKRIEPTDEKSLVSGSTKQVELSTSAVNSLVVPLPPLKEQQRIVQKVDELMALCDQLEQQTESSIEAHATLVDTLLATLTNSADADELQQNWARIAGHFDTLFTTERSIDALKQTILQLAVMGKLVRQNPNDEPASVLLERIAAEKDRLVKEKKIKKQKPLPEISEDEKPFELPEGWEWCQCNDIGNPNTIITYGILKPVWVDKGVPTVRIKDMIDGEISTGDIAMCSFERADKFTKTTLSEGDLLIAKDGATLGKTAFVPHQLAGGNITQHVLRFSIHQSVSRHFIRLIIDSPIGQGWMTGETKGVALPGVNVSDFRRMPTAIPPLNEQHRIVAKVDELMALCDQLKDKLRQSQQTQVHLTDAIVDQALA